MKFGPIIVTTLAVFSLVSAGCQRKSPKDAAREGNQLSVESAQITNDLRSNHGVNVYQSGVSAQELHTKALSKTWENSTAADRTAIRTKLTQLIAKIDRIFQIDRRKDIRVEDKTGSLKIARENAQIYLASLDKHEKALVAAPVTDAPADKGQYGWGGHGTLPTLQ